MLSRPIRFALRVLLCVLAIAAQAASDQPDPKTILDAVDKLYRSDSSYSDVEMTVTTPNWTRTMELQLWTKGMDKTLVRITSPKKDAGTATLRDKTEMWNYFPNIDKVMKVPPSMMMASWMGSDFTNDDLVRESSLRDDYTARHLPSTAPDVYVIELVRQERVVSLWGKIVLTIRRKDLIPTREDFYDEKGGLARTMEFRDIRTMGGRTMPTVMDVMPARKVGHKTTVRYRDAAFDRKVDDAVFTLRNLRRK